MTYWSSFLVHSILSPGLLLRLPATVQLILQAGYSIGSARQDESVHMVDLVTHPEDVTDTVFFSPHQLTAH
jgi:hypothetical protein